MQRVKIQSSDRSAVITKAVIRAGDQLGLKQKEISDILGLSEATISRMKKGEYFLSEEKKDFEIAALSIRLVRSLDAIVGGDPKARTSWIRSHNAYLNQAPLELMKTITGLMDVINYVDFRRAQV
ncbi:antitoxin Xre/MbcA/ParS toxin-binding domain-containing protein [uncultured Kiloniella sp.]|uniref:MbcA/ParS/Xre antitoxin family protein n=1 Tax=uncultured Kiloniella sp. TaxID=1133091 RepID=UPI0026108C58|nr:antitoxin Xre/MbcA/ParS toxin-binding domain-containing protein [uncultured Kiloniella sp.]